MDRKRRDIFEIDMDDDEEEDARDEACEPPFALDDDGGENNDNDGSHAGNGRANMPKTASAPVTSHFDALLECLDLVRLMERDASVGKQDVIDSVRPMLQTMLSTILMHNFATNMVVKGWRVQ